MAVAVFFLVATIGAIIASFTRGAWLDEYITLRLSDADFSIEQLFVERWVFDTNPPLYFFFVRVAAEFLGMDYTVLRLTNLVPLLAFAAFVAGTYVKLPAARHFLLAFTVLWCASMWFGDFFPELRNYFAQHAFGSIFLLALVVLHGWKEAAERASTWLWTWMFVSLTIIVNLHMISTLYAGALIAAFGAYNLVFPQYRMRAVWLAVGGTPQSALRAADLGLPMAFALIMGGEWMRAAPILQLYHQAGHGAGHDPSSLKTSLNAHAFVHESMEKAIDIYYPAHSARMGDLGRERGMAGQSRETFTAFCGPRGGYFVGGPTEVAEKILAAHEVLRFDRIMLQFGVGVIEHRAMLEAIEILGTRVIPEVRRGLSKSS